MRVIGVTTPLFYRRKTSLMEKGKHETPFDFWVSPSVSFHPVILLGRRSGLSRVSRGPSRVTGWTRSPGRTRVLER